MFIMYIWILKKKDKKYLLKKKKEIILNINSTVDVTKWKSVEYIFRKHSIYEYLRKINK